MDCTPTRRFRHRGQSTKSELRQTVGQQSLPLPREAVGLALRGTATGVACDGCPPLVDLAARYEAVGGRYYVCPVWIDAGKLDRESLVSGARLQGTVPMWQ